MQVKRVENIIPADREGFNQKCHNAFGACRQRLKEVSVGRLPRPTRHRYAHTVRVGHQAAKRKAEGGKPSTPIKEGFVDMVKTLVDMGYQVESH